MKKNIILILTGPGGSGKSTIAKIISEKCNFLLIDGDQIDTEFFPNGGQSLPENLDNLIKAHNKIFLETKKNYKKGRNIVIDYIIFSDYLNFLNKFKKEFGANLVIRVLLPDEYENIVRDKERSCWTTGPKNIKRVRKEFLSIKGQIGEENYIYNNNQTPKETFNKYFKTIC